MSEAKEVRKALEIFAPISEITGDFTSVVKLDESIVRVVTEGDLDPQFPIVMIEEGKSKNNINYGADILASVAEQINSKQPVGYLGHQHMEGKDKENLLPPPQTVWLGATVIKEGGKSRLYIKGYNLPDSKIRDWIKRKAVNSVSWAGDAILTPLREGGYNVKELFLESIDWSRKNQQGLNAPVLAVVSEMDKGGTKVREEEVASLQLTELETHNPGLVKVIKEMQKKDDEAAKEEAVNNAVAVKDQELADKLKEVPEVDEIQKLRTFFGIDEKKGVYDALVEMAEKFSGLSKKMLQSALDAILEEKVPNERARKLVSRLVTVTEMRRNDLEFIKDNEQIEKEITEKVEELVNEDEEIKSVITEMGSKSGGMRLNHSSGGNSGGNNNDDDAVVPHRPEIKETDNLSVVEETV